ncbi:glycerophosphodiester phosphodiesterase [Apilactobacillus micheneri]|uniref:glycerophosphodiester phosphodiesterase n=1 Tax=Apilactobacillus micheneri TaxID=1899430 RepID=UPI00112D380A|nr:glycerophosphodiester phosphodiesterase family protein [Apilactobacillus micheneri]TPR45685.1 glycerophosphodiester phosphodiesterase [Apilactobacillus micheneri]TPR49132.1 glycerophosphodiester phosphodiesterase [Apilactobacillus micheneri]
MKTMIFAHRGIPVKFPENSLEGFKYCIDNNADAVEFDVHLTKDGTPVIMHDEKIDRTTDGEGLINSYNFKDLRKFKLANGEPIPSLAEFLDLFAGKDIRLNLEFKTNKIHYQDIEEKVMNMVNDTDLMYPVIYSSFNIDSIKVAQRIDSDQDYNFLFDKRMNVDPKMFMESEHLNSLHPGTYIPGIEDHERIWTVDDDMEIHQLCKIGIQGIFTNDFEKAQKIRDEI